MDYIYARMIFTMPGYHLHRKEQKSFTKTFTEKAGKNNKEPKIKKVEYLHRELVPSESKRIITITRKQYIAMGGQPADLDKLVNDLKIDLNASTGTWELV